MLVVLIVVDELSKVVDAVVTLVVVELVVVIKVSTGGVLGFH